MNLPSRQAAPPNDHGDYHGQPDPVAAVGAVRIKIIGERKSGKDPEYPEPDGCMENAVVLLVALPEDSLFHIESSRLAARARSAQPTRQTRCGLRGEEKRLLRISAKQPSLS